METPIIAPSVLSADFSDMRSALSRIASSGAQWVHLDVMDGHFVPEITFGRKMAADLRPLTSLPLDVHLMTEHPERFAPAFLEAGADWLTFHLEACVHAHRLARSIRDSGAKSGVSVVPSTPVSALEELLDYVDLVLVMTVNPGFGGQALIPSCLDKVRRLAEIRASRGLDFLISVDGGINRSTFEAVARSGADVLVMGSAFFAASDPAAELAAVRAAYELAGEGDRPRRV
ncbi:MAG TPA: ribulose-phosphate 3-epimerase [Rectinemataceae bacterium]|nr:ribulose-phosphate 3-epimerase [Rectinemataceae bacterium]